MQKWQLALKDADDRLADVNFGSARQRVSALTLRMRDMDQPGITTIFARDGVFKPCDKQGRCYEMTNEVLLQR